MKFLQGSLKKHTWKKNLERIPKGFGDISGGILEKYNERTSRKKNKIIPWMKNGEKHGNSFLYLCRNS